MPQNILDITHPDYDYSKDAVQLVRDAMGDELAIKKSDNAHVYLPSPAPDDCKHTLPSIERYARYKARAEFSGFTSITHDEDMGSLNAKEPTIILPDEMEYMRVNSDGSGLSLKESIEITESNILQVKFHCLLGDFNGASLEDGEQITKQQAEQLGLRYTIKHYPRESMRDWQYSIFNNVSKLSYVKLIEESSDVNMETFQRTTVKNALILGLDENGEYFQQIIRESEKADEDDFIGEKVYPENSFGRLDFIPLWIVIDQKESSNSVPKGLGKLYPIALKAIARYQVNADLKEMLFLSGQPTSWSSGWSETAFELYKKITGKDYIDQGSGSHIPLPKDSNIGYLEFNADSNGLFKYMEENQKEVEAAGGKFPSNTRDEKVGVAKIRRAEDMAVYTNIVNSVEEAYQQLMILGKTFISSSDNTDDIEIKLNKVFDEVKMEASEIKEIRENVNAIIPLITRDEGIRQLERGGALTKTAEELLSEFELSGQ